MWGQIASAITAAGLISSTKIFGKIIFYICFFVSSNIQRPNKNVCRPGYSDDDAGVAEGHDQNRENPGEGEEVEEVCQLLEYPQRRGGVIIGPN